MPEEVTPDIAIVGGGIAGSWLLNRLSSEGYDTLLFEKNQLGSMQTTTAQGMIHGGIKYTLDGALSGASETIADMPRLWRKCLQGEEKPDLRQVKILSDHYYFFSDSSLSSRLTTFLGSKVVKGRVEEVKAKDYPLAFKSDEFKGKLYRLLDFVLDPRSLIHALTCDLADRIFTADVTPVMKDGGELDFLQINADIRVKAKLTIFTAGTGNEEFLNQTHKTQFKTQRRPLHQVMIKARSLPPIYAHAFALMSGSLPRVTITTHKASDDSDIWYLGGDLAETGIKRTEAEQINFAKKEIASLLPWIDLGEASWKAFRVDRAEPYVTHGQRPDSPVSIIDHNMMFCWPIKLTLTPLLAREVVEKISAIFQPTSSPLSYKTLGSLSSPQEAEAPWESFSSDS